MAMVRRTVLVLLMAVCGFSMVAGSALAATADEAKAYADSIGSRVLKVLNDPKQGEKTKISSLEKLFTDVVDVNWVGRFVLGRHWKEAKPEDQAEYLKAYREFLIKHYTSRFTKYSGQTYTLPIAREERKDEFFVRMEIAQPQGQAPVVVDYRLRSSNGKFKVFDIIVEGVSLITTQRSEFDSMVSRKGMEALVAKLKEKTVSLQQQMETELAS